MYKGLLFYSFPLQELKTTVCLQCLSTTGGAGKQRLSYSEEARSLFCHYWFQKEHKGRKSQSYCLILGAKWNRSTGVEQKPKERTLSCTGSRRTKLLASKLSHTDCSYSTGQGHWTCGGLFTNLFSLYYCGEKSLIIFQAKVSILFSCWKHIQVTPFTFLVNAQELWMIRFYFPWF